MNDSQLYQSRRKTARMAGVFYVILALALLYSRNAFSA